MWYREIKGKQLGTGGVVLYGVKKGETGRYRVNKGQQERTGDTRLFVGIDSES